MQSLKTVAKVVDAKDKYTNGHSFRVAAYVAEIYRRLGKSKDEIENAYYCGLLHDVGKISIPEQILNKPGKLTEEEFNIIKTHTTIGGDILKDVKGIPDVSDAARYHHERYDGKGYMSGLKGEEIPFIARTISIADVMDAMLSDRVYRKGLPVEVCISELQKGSGTQFDPVLAALGVQMLKDKFDPEEINFEFERDSVDKDVDIKIK